MSVLKKVLVALSLGTLSPPSDGTIFSNNHIMAFFEHILNPILLEKMKSHRARTFFPIEKWQLLRLFRKV